MINGGWKCNNMHVQVADEAFLIRQGQRFEQGIIGHGRIAGPIQPAPSFTTGKPYRCVPIQWDAFKFYGNPLISKDALRGINILWGAQSSGIIIEPDAHKALREVWRKA